MFSCSFTNSINTFSTIELYSIDAGLIQNGCKSKCIKTTVVVAGWPMGALDYSFSRKCIFVKIRKIKSTANSPNKKAIYGLIYLLIVINVRRPVASDRKCALHSVEIEYNVRMAWKIKLRSSDQIFKKFFDTLRLKPEIFADVHIAIICHFILFTKFLT